MNDENGEVPATSRRLIPDPMSSHVVDIATDAGATCPKTKGPPHPDPLPRWRSCSFPSPSRRARREGRKRAFEFRGGDARQIQQVGTLPDRSAVDPPKGRVKEIVVHERLKDCTPMTGRGSKSRMSIGLPDLIELVTRVVSMMSSLTAPLTLNVCEVDRTWTQCNGTRSRRIQQHDGSATLVRPTC